VRAAVTGTKDNRSGSPVLSDAAADGRRRRAAAPEWPAVRAARLIDGAGAPPLERPTVVVRRGRLSPARDDRAAVAAGLPAPAAPR
jgi:hypothetical protein